MNSTNVSLVSIGELGHRKGVSAEVRNKIILADAFYMAHRQIMLHSEC